VIFFILIPTHPDAIKKKGRVSGSYSTNDTHRGFFIINPEISPHRTRFDIMNQSKTNI
jgi:hypothetical protein